LAREGAKAVGDGCPPEARLRATRELGWLPGADRPARELAPSSDLRRWFGHDPARFEEFRRRSRDELATQGEKLRELRGRARKGTLTLVYSARDTEHNDAVVPAELLRSRSQ
jgi:uncharacterized protein YeaO (DUF488 family)